MRMAQAIDAASIADEVAESPRFRDARWSIAFMKVDIFTIISHATPMIYDDDEISLAVTLRCNVA